MDALIAFVQANNLASSWDLAILIFLTLAAIIYGLYVGRDRMVIILFATYIALAVVTNAPVLAVLSNALRVGQNPTLNLVWFLGLFVVTLVLLWRSRILKNLAHDRGAWWESALFTILQVGLSATIILFLLPQGLGQNLNGLIQSLFIGPAARSFWMLTPILLLAFLNGKNAEWDEDEDERHN